jgi:cytochrome c
MRLLPARFAALVLVPAALSAQTADPVQARMQAWSKALGVECTHCHIEGDYKAAVLPQFDMAFRMMARRGQTVNVKSGSDRERGEA